MAVAMIGPKIYCWDRNGKPLAFGKLYTYEARTNTPKDTWQSEDQQVTNSNPVILNGEGYANVYLSGSYKMVLKDKDDNEIWSSDPVSSAAATEWNFCLAPIYVSSTIFKLTGNFLNEYTVGRRVRIDNNTSNYSYSTISTVSYAAGETTVTIFNPVITTGIVESCVSIVGPESQARTAEGVTLSEPTLQSLIDADYIRTGDSINVKERTSGNGGGAVWGAVPIGSVTPNGDNIVALVGVPSLAAVQRNLEDIYVVKTVSNLVSTDLIPGQTALTQGKSSVDDGQSEKYYIVSSDDFTGTPDEIDDYTLENGNIAKLLRPINTRLGNAISKAVDGSSMSIAFYGDSMTYGFETGGPNPPINGATDQRAAYQYPESLGSVLTTIYDTPPVIYNRGYPGDTSESWKTRWPTSLNNDVVFIMYGHNDSKNQGDSAGQPAVVDINQYKINIRQLIEREIATGAAVILLLPPSLQDGNATGTDVIRRRQQRIMLTRQTIQELATEFNLPTVDVNSIVEYRGDDKYSDAVHYNGAGYNEWGWNLAASLLPGGIDKEYKLGDSILPVGADTLGFLTVNAGSRHSSTFLNTVNSTDRPYLCVYGRFKGDGYLHATTYNITGGGEDIAIVKSGGGRSSLPDSTTVLDNNNLTPNRRVSGALHVPSGMRVVFIQVAAPSTLAAIEAVKFSKSCAVNSIGVASEQHENVSMIANGTLAQCSLSQARLLKGGTARLQIHMESGASKSTGIMIGNTLSANGVPSKHILLSRLSDTTLFVRKFDGTPVDNTVASIFSAGVDDYNIDLYRKPDGTNGEIEIWVDGVLADTITDVNDYLDKDGYIGVYASNFDKGKAYTNSIITTV